MTDDLCAWCEAPRTTDAVCPRCGANYAKAAAIKQRGSAKGIATPADTATVEPRTDAIDADNLLPVRDPASEWNNCLYAWPVMLLGAWACQYFNVFDSLQRIVFGMPVHESGHALTAWLTGYDAIPTFWFTHTSAERGWFCMLLLFALYAALWRHGQKSGERGWYVLVIALFLLQMSGTFGISTATADMLVVFGGDAMGMVLATALMATFHIGKHTQLYKGSVRWGLLFWGAAAFMDIFMAWWEGQRDISRVGYGTTGGSFTDAYLLINAYGWNWDEMINRHLLVGYLCLLAQTVIYGLGLWQAQGWLQQHAKAERLARIRAGKSGVQNAVR